MLQQTQVGRVQSKLPEFLKQFPTIKSLAHSSRADVLRVWKGMGYNNRAVRLQQCAKIIVEKYGGKIPTIKEQLLALPGIGEYTSSAISVFAFQKNFSVVDVNIRRVYSRILWKMKTFSNLQTEKKISETANKIFPNGKSSEWHQAIMDIGSQFCLARKAHCELCPLKSLCVSANRMECVPSQANKEKLFYGKPFRYWRGRVVEALRAVRAQTYLSEQLVLKKIFLKQSKARANLLSAIIVALEKDNIIEMKYGNDKLQKRIRLNNSKQQQ